MDDENTIAKKMDLPEDLPMNDCENSNANINFRLAVMTQLTALAEGQKSLVLGQNEICKKLDKANGNIGELFDKAAEGKIALLDHIIECPQKGVLENLRLKIDVLDKELALGTHPGSKEVNKKVEALQIILENIESNRKLSRWLTTLAWPIVSAAGGALVMYAIEVARRLPVK
jgi:hypothetical protein